LPAKIKVLISKCLISILGVDAGRVAGGSNSQGYCWYGSCFYTVFYLLTYGMAIGNNEDLIYQLDLHAQELCQLCVIW
jgi:hypothetical protein